MRSPINYIIKLYFQNGRKYQSLLRKAGHQQIVAHLKPNMLLNVLKSINLFLVKVLFIQESSQVNIKEQIKNSKK